MNADLDDEDSRWLIVEDGFTTALASTYETLIAPKDRCGRWSHGGRVDVISQHDHRSRLRADIGARPDQRKAQTAVRRQYIS